MIKVIVELEFEQDVINQQDVEFITTSKVIDLTAQEKLYLGGEFGSNEKDHIPLF